MALTDNLLGYWKLDETSGSTLTDSTGTRNGTVNGSVTLNQTGKLGKAVLIDASTEYISFSAITQLSGTYAFWIYPTSFADDRLILSDGDGFYKRIFITTSGYIRVETNTNGQEFQWGSGQMTVNNWYHVVLTREENGTGMKFYLNGTFISNTSVGSPDSITTSQIGCNGRSFYGLIDEVAIWSSVLEQADVTALYNSGNGLTYPFMTGFDAKRFKFSTF